MLVQAYPEIGELLRGLFRRHRGRVGTTRGDTSIGFESVETSQRSLNLRNPAVHERPVRTVLLFNRRMHVFLGACLMCRTEHAGDTLGDA